LHRNTPAWSIILANPRGLKAATDASGQQSAATGSAFLNLGWRGGVMRQGRGADVVCATAIGAGAVTLNDHTFTRVLFDEAAQATEVSVLVPLLKMHSFGTVTLVGDHRQLPPTVVDQEVEPRERSRRRARDAAIRLGQHARRLGKLDPLPRVRSRDRGGRHAHHRECDRAASTPARAEPRGPSVAVRSRSLAAGAGGGARVRVRARGGPWIGRERSRTPEISSTT